MAVQNVSTFTNSKREASSEAERRGLAAQERVKRGQVSRARQALVGAALSPKTEETLEELRRRRPQAALRQIPQEVMDYAPESPLAMDMNICEMSPHCTCRVVSQTRGMLERDVQGLPRRPRDVPIVVPGS